MGWEMHISRATFASCSNWFPILEREVVGLVDRHDDLAFTPERGQAPDPGTLQMIWWTPGDGAASCFRYARGALHAKHPEPATQRRMVGMAAGLDAWLLRGDSDQYELWADGILRPREVPLLEYRREWGIVLGVGDHAIAPAEWFAFVATQPDFRLAGEVEAWLPSGLRTVASPPTAIWHGHPAGRPVPFFCDPDGIQKEIQTRGYDEPVLGRCLELARHFGVEIYVPDGRTYVWPPGADQPVVTRPGLPG
jgi:hypothetical protein